MNVQKLHFQREKNQLVTLSLHTYKRSTLSFSQSLSLETHSAIHCPSPFTQHSSSPFTQLQCFTTRHPLLFKIPLQHQVSFSPTYIHPPTHYYITSFHIFNHPFTSSYIIIHSALQQNQSKHLLLQSAQLRYFGIKSASIFNLSNIICSLSAKFHTQSSIMSSSSGKVDKSSNTPDIGVGLPTKPTNTPIINPIPNPFRDQMPTTLMSRKTFSKAGKPAMIQLNSHIVEQWPNIDVCQYDVSLL